MSSLTRREFIKTGSMVALGAIVTDSIASESPNIYLEKLDLKNGWLLQSSTLVDQSGKVISSSAIQPLGWHKTPVPCTVLNALVKNGVYPDPRIGLNTYKVPDLSDEFNEKFDLAKFSHLPNKRNPWMDPWWFRREFTLPKLSSGQNVWLHFDSINYRAEVWLNGNKVADHEQMVSMNQRFVFDVTPWSVEGLNYMAVKIWPVDHVGSPGPQLVPLNGSRFEDHESDGPMDYAVQLAGGYDCFPSIPDRYMGILQDVWLEFSGPVVIRDPFVVTELPLPNTDRATLKISTMLVNNSGNTINGTLKGTIDETGLVFEMPVILSAAESKIVVFDPAPVMKNPKLWWPNGYGAQPLYDMKLQFVAGGIVSHIQKVRFGVRQITTELHEYNGHNGRRIHINGQKIFARGGYIQPDALLDWTPERIDNEIRYYAAANLTLIYFEEIANPPDFLFEACDRYGVMIGQCFYGCSWMKTGSKYPGDIPLVIKCTRDILKRYRNHPSLVMYMASNEGFTREEVYRPWRTSVIELDGSRFWIPSGGMPNVAADKVEPWFQEDMPTGMSDNGGNSYGWEEPSEYYRRVREVPNWMFMLEVGSASLPPLSSLQKFIPNLGEVAPGPTFPLDATWAHHGANQYYKPYDAAIRRVYGEPSTVGDYVWQGHLATADQHRAMYEAVNHRLWDITSGFTQWKINSAWPDVQWQIFDWYLKPMVSYYFIKRANEPVHIQLGLLEPMVTVVNHSLEPQKGMKVRARVLDTSMHVLFEKQANTEVAANAYLDLFELPKLDNLPPVYFVRLDLSDASGKRISDNLYWFPAQEGGSMQALHTLPQVKLLTTCKIESNGKEKVARVKITNPTGQIAFFVQLALAKGKGGAEILPVLWEDNYLSLMPGESREITATFAAKHAGNITPALEVGGWNVESEFDCESLSITTKDIKVNEQLNVSADISNTFLDGSCVALKLDGQPVAFKWAWARTGKPQTIVFQFRFDKPGRHEITVGGKKISVTVNT